MFPYAYIDRCYVISQVLIASALILYSTINTITYEIILMLIVSTILLLNEIIPASFHSRTRHCWNCQDKDRDYRLPCSIETE